ncbi:unnamed protein product [Brachionus calyciflorus]|uniref:Ribosomal protein eL8/eL30/eS12/Gadd45 domain-containing protein n=1 Tax=Brachionus calyciflorus TaxID=104777 RepID=A0A813MF25_9BILA|nr:unnamed protein product [Brachionus calyciflorus]
MKSLSPNAEEFVPLSFSQRNIIPQQPLQTFFIDPSNGTTSPVVHLGYQNISYGYQTNQNFYNFYNPNPIFVPPPHPNRFFYPNSNYQKSQNFQNNSKQSNRKPENKSKPRKKHNFKNNTPNFDLNDFPVLCKNESEKVTPINVEPLKKEEDGLLKKDVKFVNFIKESVEQNYLTENESKPKETKAPSFKDAILSSNKVAENIEEKKTKKNKKKNKKKTSTESQVEAPTNQTIVNKEQFLLNINEFPDLGTTIKPDLNRSFTDDRHQSDAYSSDATLDANAYRLRSQSQASRAEPTPTNQPKTSSKKLNQPLTIEFANMISALQKDQYNSKYKANNFVPRIHTTTRPTFNPLTDRPGHNTGHLVNPLDPSSILKRGKEREKPKSKKKSTLKKIILREREEKRKKIENNLIHENQSEDEETSIPNISYLFLSPRKAEEISENENEDNINGCEIDESDVNTEILSPISQPSPLSINGYNPSPYANLNYISNEKTLVLLEKLEEQVKQKIHSRKFREYCNQIVNKDIDEVCLALLHDIVRFQDRLYHKYPNKAKVKRRYVMGIREVTKHLKLQKLKCVIIAPNCEKIESKGGLDDAINLIIQNSIEQNVPFLFALGRRDLGKAVKKLVPISVIGIFDYSGAEEHFKRLVQLANNAKLAYQDMIEELEREECEYFLNTQDSKLNFEPIKDKIDDLPTNNQSYKVTNFNPKIPSHMAHSRTPSNGSNISIEPFYHMNYHTHSRSASGNFNYGHTNTIGGHSRAASGGGIGPGGLNLDLLAGNKNWTHSRTPSNCSNISFISRMSEPMSESGVNIGINSNSTATQAAVQFYTEQVRQEMKKNSETSTLVGGEDESKINEINEGDKISESLTNLHLGCISEMDAGNDADTEDYNESKAKMKQFKD